MNENIDQTTQPDQATFTIKDPDGNVVGGGPIVQPEKQLSIGEIKKLRKQYVTIAHPRVAGCGHRLDLNRQPRHRNCQTCWFAWFQNHGEICQQLDEMHQASGDAMIVQLQGKKFLHRWRMFMATVAQWKQVTEVPDGA